MWQLQNVEAVLRTLSDRRTLADPHLIKEGGSDQPIEIQGTVSVAQKEVTLRIAVSSTLSLPSIYLDPPTILGTLPHLLANGIICYLDSEGLVFDWRRPIDVLDESIRAAKRTLEKGLSGEGDTDFADDLSAQWGQLPNTDHLFSLLAPGDDIEWIHLITLNSEPGEIGATYAVRRHDDIKSYRSIGEGYSGTSQRALFVPLNAGEWISPQDFQALLGSPASIREVLLPKLSEKNIRRLKRYARKKTKATERVILSSPRPSGGVCLLGFKFSGVEGAHPLSSKGQADKTTPVIVQRRDREFLLPRGGAQSELAGKRTLLAGCGAIGGHIALLLARLGFSNLVLVDPDTLETENLFRHALGRRYTTTNKATALASEIRKQLPYTEVVAIPTRLEEALQEDIHLQDFDLVVLATGNPSVELAVNAEIVRSTPRPLTVFSWLEPFGLGGHALITGLSKEGGCFECLYSRAQESYLHNRASFAAPGQRFGRDLIGCGHSHHPYSSLDAVRTAHLATQVALTGINGSLDYNQVVSWRGDSVEFVREGYQTSTRYRSEPALSELTWVDFRDPSCPACSPDSFNVYAR